jgi:hypothetical protein
VAGAAAGFFIYHVTSADFFCHHREKVPNLMISFFPPLLVTYGVNSKEQRSIVKTFLRNVYNVNVDQILTAVMNEYTDYRHTGENKLINRDTLLSIFSDARVAAPLVRTASLQTEAKQQHFRGQPYVFVFKHVTKKGYYPEASFSGHPTMQLLAAFFLRKTFIRSLRPPLVFGRRPPLAHNKREEVKKCGRIMGNCKSYTLWISKCHRFF